MKLLDVYPLFDVEPLKAEGSFVWDKNGEKYLDLYGGHAVISIGHSHPYYVRMLSEQLNRIAFYSNSVKIGIQQELAEKLGRISGYDDYQLFLCNSGAEANENALKLASFQTGRKKIIAFEGSFHGRTSLAVAATDDRKLLSPVNETSNVIFLPFNDPHVLQSVMNEEIAAVIVEGIQGVAGIRVPTAEFLHVIRESCDQHGAMMIVDEVQSGCGRTGKFFAHQHSGVRPDLITMAKGMGNGFPVAGVMSAPHIRPTHGMLGTTFGGNYLACAASIAVLDVMEKESLIRNAEEKGKYLIRKLKSMEGIREIRGSGLLIGIEFDFPCSVLRNELLSVHRIFTGSSSCKNTLRILPALNIAKSELDQFIHALERVNSKKMVL